MMQKQAQSCKKECEAGECKINDEYVDKVGNLEMRIDQLTAGLNNALADPKQAALISRFRRSISKLEHTLRGQSRFIVEDKQTYSCTAKNPT